MSFAALIAFVAAAQAPVVVTRTPPPERNASAATAEGVSTSDIDFSISTREGPLWQGSLRVGQRGPSSMSMDRTEAPPANCVPAERYSTYFRNNLKLSVNTVRANGDYPLYRIDVSWTRPQEGDCFGGTRTVELTQNVELPPGRDVTVQGDGALTVRLRLR